MASGNSQLQTKVTVTNESTVGAVIIGENVKFTGNVYIQSSSQTNLENKSYFQHSFRYIKKISNQKNGFNNNALKQTGINVNITNKKLLTPIHAAAFHWDLEAMIELIANNANINARNSKGEIPLFHFIRGAYLRKNINMEKVNEILKLLKFEDCKNITNSKGQTLMYIAASSCLHNTDLLNLLLQRGFDVNSSANNVQATALHAAAFHWNLNALKFLIAHNANLKAKNKNGRTALFYFMYGARFRKIINLDYVHEVLELLQFNQNIDITSNNNNTLLYSAASSYHDELVSLFLTKYKMNVNHQDLQGDTPLHNVIIKLGSRGSRSLKDVIRTVNVLKEHGARLDMKNKAGKTPLQIALEKGATFLCPYLA